MRVDLLEFTWYPKPPGILLLGVLLMLLKEEEEEEDCLFPQTIIISSRIKQRTALQMNDY